MKSLYQPSKSLIFWNFWKDNSVWHDLSTLGSNWVFIGYLLTQNSTVRALITVLLMDTSWGIHVHYVHLRDCCVSNTRPVIHHDRTTVMGSRGSSPAPESRGLHSHMGLLPTGSPGWQTCQRDGAKQMGIKCMHSGKKLPLLPWKCGK